MVSSQAGLSHYTFRLVIAAVLHKACKFFSCLACFMVLGAHIAHALATLTEQLASEKHVFCIMIELHNDTHVYNIPHVHHTKM